MNIVVRQATYASLILATIGIGMGFQQSGPISPSAPGGDRTWSKHWAYEQQRNRAHRRMKNTMYASTPDRPDVTVMCPVLSDGRLGPSIAMDWRGAFLKADVGRYSAKSDEVESETALDYFLNHISGPIVQAKCVNCHVEGGVSGHTRLVLQPSSNPDHGALNLAVFENFLADVEDGGDLILNKIQGVGHGGGVQVAAGSDDFANMEHFLGLLGHGDGSGPGLSPETLFDTVTMTSPGKTLRRAALIFGGKVPTREERESVDNGTEEDLRTAIRERMTGRGFHEFLIRASNDRLLTDREFKHLAIDYHFVNFTNRQWEFHVATREKDEQHLEFKHWAEKVFHGFVRAPLELIAHVVENDLPYTEVLTADYVMANPTAAEAYGAATEFDDSEDPLEFRPSKIVSYYRKNKSMVHEHTGAFGHRVLDPGNLRTDWPHAGILNTLAFLQRYPTTPTNRNRARSRWTYYHFLDLDIEKSASRTTDPVALADTDNPTMNNPACTVCHRVMDPVAGTFQNYGEEGHYRDEWGGLDSLDEFYKYPPDGSYSPYQEGDSWYRDMRDPGFGGQIAPNAENSLQWLAEQIVADDRFAEATVKFWWPAILGIEVAEPPEDENDADFEAMLLASNAQTAEVERLAEAFRTGIAGGAPYNLKDLLVEIVLSPWFRADSIMDDEPVRAVALQNAGGERLLTPEELAWKTEAITGYSWGSAGWERSYLRWPGNYTHLTGFEGHQRDGYRLLYGGIDSGGITERADDMTTIMAAVAQSHAVEVSCPIVQREFLFWPDEKRRLFGGIDEHMTPVYDGEPVLFEITSDIRKTAAPQTVSFQTALDPSTKNIRLAFTNDYWEGEDGKNRNLFLDRIEVRGSSGNVVTKIEFNSEGLDSVAAHGNHNCGENWRGSNLFNMWGNCSLAIPVEIPVSDDYTIEVAAFQEQAGDDPARLEVSVESDIETSQGAMAIRNKLVELHEKLLGVTVTADSPEVDAAFRLFVEVWDRERRDDRTWFQCPYNMLYFEDVADVLDYEENSYPKFNPDRQNEVLKEYDFHNVSPVARTWMTVLAYFLTDYRYLFL